MTFWQSMKRLLRFRLFWRIFLAFWLASLAIMAATAFVIVDRFESSRYQQRHQQMLLEQGRDVIAALERGERPRPRRMPPEQPPKQPRGEHHGPPPIVVLDSDGEVLFGRRPREGRQREQMSVTITGDSGRVYQVQSPMPHIPLFFREVLSRFYSLQFFLILLTSALVSALLSWSITRPLKRLGQYSRHFDAGHNPEPLPDKLLSRSDEVGDLARETAQMSRRVTTTLQAQQQLLHHVSHELRAPLARLQAAAGLLEQKLENDSLTGRIHRECQQMDRLIQQILNFSRLAEVGASPAPMRLDTLLEEMVEALQLEFPERRFDLQLKELTVMACDDSLGQAVENLLRNACKYSPPNLPVDVGCQYCGTEAVITIRDHGDGIDPAETEKLLQPFYRAGNRMHTDGFGLGLAIASKAVTQHKGSLQLSNHPEGGLQARITLPTVSSL